MTPEQDTSRLKRRRQYYIKRSFQRRFIIQFSFLILLGCVTFGLATYYYSYSSRSLTTAFVNSRLQVMSTAEFLLPALGVITLCITALVAVAVAFRLLLFSHRIAGPLYRLEKTAQQVGRGNLDFHVQLRSKDELQDFAQAMDTMISDLRSRIQRIRELNQSLGEKILEAGRKSSMPKDLFESVRKIQEELDEAINRFQA